MGFELLGAGAGAGRGLEDLLTRRLAEQHMQQGGLEKVLGILGLRDDRRARNELARSNQENLRESRNDANRNRELATGLQLKSSMQPGSELGPVSFDRMVKTGAFLPEEFNKSPGTAASLPSVNTSGFMPLDQNQVGAVSETQESSRPIDASYRFKGTAQQQAGAENLDLKRSQLQAKTDADAQRADFQNQMLDVRRDANDVRRELGDLRNQPKPVDQNKLEQNYRNVLMRAVSNRSGGLGLEDQKVNQSNHLLALLDQYEGKPMPANIAAEVALGLARLTSPSGQVGVELMRELNQHTLQGNLGRAAAFVTGDPTLLNATPEKVRQVFRDSIIRQGQVSEQSRAQYMDYLRSQAPTDLDEARRTRLESGTLNPLRGRGVGGGVGGGGTDPNAPKKRIVYGMNGKPIE